MVRGFAGAGVGAGVRARPRAASSNSVRVASSTDCRIQPVLVVQLGDVPPFTPKIVSVFAGCLIAAGIVIFIGSTQRSKSSAV
jgi:hypothetical protein